MSNQFVYKPVSDSKGRLVVVVPSRFTGSTRAVQILDAKGNVVESGQYRNSGNGNRGNWDFSRQGQQYAGGTVRIVLDDGNVITQSIGSGGRQTRDFSSWQPGENSKIDPNDIPSGGGDASSLGGGGAGTLGGSTVGMSPGGSPFIIPGAVDYSTLQAPYVDFQANLDRAKTEGEFNKEQIYKNIEDSKASALSLVDTDIEGIQKGLNAFIPQIRTQGDIDQATNITRAGDIDRANISRIPGLNEFNRGEVSKTNEFNQLQKDRAVDAAGLGYRQRIGDLVSNLSDRSSTGRLSGGLDESLSRELANRGSDLGRASGIGALSRAGIRANDRLTVQERVNLALGAEAALPGVLEQGQNRLESTPERAPTLFAEPQPIPLSVSNVADRMPMTSNISAGSAQQAIASEVNQNQLIPATGVFTSGLNTDMFNEQAAYNRDLTVLDRTQQQMVAGDSAAQGALNTDLAAGIRAEQYGAFQQGNQVLQNSQAMSGYGNLAGGIQAIGSLTGLGSGGSAGGGAATTGGTTPTAGVPTVDGNLQSGQVVYDSNGNPIASSAASTLGTDQAQVGSTGPASPTAPILEGSSLGGGSGSVTSAPSGGFSDSSVISGGGSSGVSSSGGFDLFGSSGTSQDAGLNYTPVGRSVKIGSATINEADYSAFQQGIKEFNSTPKSAKAITKEGKATAKPGVAPTNTTAQAPGQPQKEPTMLDQAGQVVTEARNEANAFITDVTKPFTDEGVDLRVVGQTADALSNWDRLSVAQQMGAGGNIGIDVLENRGMVNPEDARDIRSVTGALGVIADPNSTTEQRAAAVLQAGGEYATTSFTGDINAPRTIGGRAVLGSTVTPDGQPAFTVAQPDGSTSVVSQSELVNGANVMGGINAFSILMSNANNEQKLTALTQQGIGVAAANDMISQVAAGNTLAGLSIFNTAMNWDDMNNIQRGVSVMQTGAQVLNSTYGQAIAQGITNYGSSIASSLFGSATTQATAQVGASAGSSAAASAGASASSTATSQLISGLGTAAGVAAFAYGTYQVYQGAQRVGDLPSSQQGANAGATIGSATAAGAALGSVVPVIGTAIGAAVGAVVGAVVAGAGAFTASSKGAGQMMRDSWRSGLEKGGFATKNKDTGRHEVTLADGSKYDIGLDGGHQIPNKGINVDGKATRAPKDVDWSNPIAVGSIPDAHIYSILTGMDPTTNKKLDAFHATVGLSLNAATSNAKSIEDVRENYRSMLGRAGVQPADAFNRIEMLRVTNKITEDEYGVYVDRANTLFGTKVLPSDRAQTTANFVKVMGQTPVDKMDDYSKAIYKSLTDPKEMAKSEKELAKRLKNEDRVANRNPDGSEKKPEQRTTLAQRNQMAVERSQAFDGKLPAPRDIQSQVAFDDTRFQTLENEQSNPRLKTILR